MKTSIFSILILVVLATIDCQRQNEVNSHEDQNIGIDPGNELYVDDVKVDSILLGPSTTHKQITLREEFILRNGVTLPVGTVISKMEDDPYSLSYTVPEGYLITGVSQANGRVVATMAGSITCTCTKGSGCSPFIALGQEGR